MYTGRIADKNDNDLRYSEVPLKEKNKNTCQNIGGRDPCNPCGADAYGVLETATYETVFVVIRATIILSAKTVI